MRTFNIREKILLRAISEIDSRINTSLEEFLEKLYFTEKKGRALIIQTIDHYTVLYLKNNLFDDEKIKKNEIDYFLEMVSLIKYLKDNHFITLLPPDNKKEKPMYFIQDGFEDPQPGTGNIILNKNGDYTNKPESILDKNNTVIYKGIFFDLNTYHSLDRNLKGIILVSEQCKNLVNNNFRTKNEKKQHVQKWAFWIFSILTLILFVTTAYFLFNKTTYYESVFNNINASTNEIQKELEETTLKLNALGNSIKKRDSIFIDEIDKTTGIFYGIDISRYNKNLVDEINQLDSLAFVICKATEGLHYRDPYFNSNWKAIKNKNLIRGAYHFFHESSDPIKQAIHYLSVVEKWEATDITPIIDIEMQSLSTNINIDKLQENILIFLNYVENHTSRIPMIYTNHNFANQYLSNKVFSKYPLWLAEYTSKDYPTIPNTWKSKGFKIWQKSENYHFKSSIDDLDVFYGQISDLSN